MTDNPPVLVVEGLSVRRGEQLAVEQVSFQLARETDTALVGPNGAGKSSLVAALLGLLPRAAGSVRILGHALGPAGELLVLDEAQAGLDAPSSEQFQELLLDLRRQEGWTVLQVSHDLEMVRRSCDQVLCLNRRLRCSGAPDHALSAARLAELYGPNVVPYRHNHAGIAGHG